MRAEHAEREALAVLTGMVAAGVVEDLPDVQEAVDALDRALSEPFPEHADDHELRAVLGV